MDEFTAALYGRDEQTIPPEYDWFAPLLGDWDFDYYDGDPGAERHVEGEWIFRRILNGAGIEDLFLCPSRATRETKPQPDGEYGLAVRMFNPVEKVYDMVYACKQYVTALTFIKEGEQLIGTVKERPFEKWVFFDIFDDSFRWQNVTVLGDGSRKINSNIYARRKPRG